MGTNVNGINAGDELWGKRGPVFKDSEQSEQTAVQQEPVTNVPIGQPKQSAAPKTDDQILAESEQLPEGYHITLGDDAIKSYEQKASEITNQVEQSLRKAGIEPKSLEYSGTWEDLKKPKDEDEARYAYRRMRYNGQLTTKDEQTGEIRNLTDEEIDLMAKDYIRDQSDADVYNRTHTFMDKDKYKKAEADRLAKREDLIKQYRAQGLSKKEAKAKADAELPINHYASKGWKLFHIGKSAARKIYERNPELYNDENGEYSDEKFKAGALDNAQKGRKPGEITRHSFLLRQNDLVRAEESLYNNNLITRHQLNSAEKFAGIRVERDKTVERRVAVGATVATATTVAATAVGAPVLIGTGTAGACGFCGTLFEIPAAAAGATSGTVLGTLASGLVKRDPGKPYNTITDIVPKVQPQQPTQPVTPVCTPEKQCPENPVDEEVCRKIVQKGSSWSYYAENSGITINGKKPAGKELNAYLYAQQLMYGIQNPKGLKENRFLSVGSEYVQHSDFSKLFENEEIMAKYGNILNILKDAKIDTSKCKDLNGPVRGRTPNGFRYGGTVNGNTTIRTRIYDCDHNLIRVEDK